MSRTSVTIRLTPTQRRALAKLTGVQHSELRFERASASRGYAGAVVLTSKTTPNATPYVNPRLLKVPSL